MHAQQRTGRLRGATAEVLRALVATGLLMSAVVHFDLWAQGVRQVEVIGPLFLLNSVAGLVLTLLLLSWKHWLPVLAAILFGGLTLIAFGLAVTVGLFGTREVAEGVPQLLAGAAEIVAVVCGVLLLIVGTRART